MRTCAHGIEICWDYQRKSDLVYHFDYLYYRSAHSLSSWISKSQNAKHKNERYFLVRLLFRQTSQKSQKNRHFWTVLILHFFFRRSMHINFIAKVMTLDDAFVSSLANLSRRQNVSKLMVSSEIQFFCSPFNRKHAVDVRCYRYRCEWIYIIFIKSNQIKYQLAHTVNTNKRVFSRCYRQRQQQQQQQEHLYSLGLCIFFVQLPSEWQKRIIKTRENKRQKKCFCCYRWCRRRCCRQDTRDMWLLSLYYVHK